MNRERAGIHVRKLIMMNPLCIFTLSEPVGYCRCVVNPSQLILFFLVLSYLLLCLFVVYNVDGRHVFMPYMGVR